VKKTKAVAVALTVIMILSMAGCATPGSWTDDIEQLRAFVLETHPKFTDETLANLERNTAIRAAFHEALDTLLTEAPYLTDFEAMVGLQRAIAVLEDNHFNLFLAELEQEEEIAVYPLGFRWLSDGFYLLTTVEGFEHALNHRLISINGRNIENIFAEFRTLWSVENIYNARATFARLLGNPILLDAMDLGDEGNIIFDFENDSGDIVALKLTPADESFTDINAAVFFPIFPVDNRIAGGLPLFMDIRGGEMTGHNWFKFLAEHEILYIRLELYMQNTDETTGMFAPFAQDVKAAFEENTPAAVIIDARHNPGGDNAYLAELFEFLAHHTDPGRLFHFIDEGAMSASLLGAAHLKSLGAVLLGQPTGQNTEFYGFHTVTVSDGDIYFTISDLPEDMGPDDYIEIGMGMDEYPYFEVITMTIGELHEMIERTNAEAEGMSYTLELPYSGLLVSVPNMSLSASHIFELELELYTLRPHVLIAYTIQDWINNRDPLLTYVIELLR